LIEEARLYFIGVRLMEEAQAALVAVDEMAREYAAECSC